MSVRGLIRLGLEVKVGMIHFGNCTYIWPFCFNQLGGEENFKTEMPNAPFCRRVESPASSPCLTMFVT